MELEELKKELKELKKELKELKKEFNELAKIINKEVPSARWRADEDEKYYFIDRDGDVDFDLDVRERTSINHYNLGNYFQTKEETEKVVEKIKIYTQLKDLALKLNKGKKIDWKNNNQPKYYIYYDSNDNLLKYTCRSTSRDMCTIYCLNHRFFDIAKPEIGEEKLIKLFE